MIPLIPSEPGKLMGPATSTRGSPGDSAASVAFDDFMDVPDSAFADVGVTATGAPSEIEVGEPELMLLPTGESISGDGQGVLVSLRPDQVKDAAPVAGTTILQQNGREPGPPLRGLGSPPGNDMAPTGTPTPSSGAEMARAKPVSPSVAQAVLEGRLPQSTELTVGRTQSASAGLSDIAASDVPPRSAALPLADKITATAVYPPAAPKPPPDAAPNNEGSGRRADTIRLRDADATQSPAPQVTAQAQQPAVTITQAAAGPRRDAAETNLNITEGELILSSAPADRRMTVTSAQVSAPASAASEAARNAATQIAAAITSNDGKTTEILLNPEELGRVRLSMAVDDNAIVLNVSAERSETQDLLRRHMDQLAQEFRDLGYASISFTFGEQKGETHAAFAQPDETPEPEIEAVTAELNTDASQTNAGLDLRI